MYAKNKEFGSEMPQKAVSLTEQWNYWMCGLFVMFWIFFLSGQWYQMTTYMQNSKKILLSE